MDNTWQDRLLDYLKLEFCPDDTTHILAVSVVNPKHGEYKLKRKFKVRVALTFLEDEGVNPYFDGTDLYVSITPTDIYFEREDEWADGPPIMEGSPIELALGWVSELALPFYVSLEAQETANKERG
ncbi:hypothetical protein MKZ07_23215 [Paenibacillus sp. FSL P4-0338]|uniref:hypothetical protein n=1 Tax=Paenibacillus sp. FSL P4-0338 TaxID=2921635 RepID=UPI0030FCCF7B